MLQVSVDDAGVDEGIDDAIVHLARKQLIGSVSLMVNYPRAHTTARRLLAEGMRIGLHINISSGAPVLARTNSLTYGAVFCSPRQGLSADEPFEHAIDRYIADHIDRVVRQRDLADEVDAQRDEFMRVAGRSPEFVSVHHDLDRSIAVREVMDRHLRDLPSRQLRITSGALVGYQSFFVVPGENVDGYLVRILDTMQEWLNDNNEHLAVFHPSVQRPDSSFTVYQRGRMVEYRALLTARAARVLRQTHGEIGLRRGGLRAYRNV